MTVNGTVLGEQRVEHGKGPKAVRLVIKVGDEQVSVQLGPDVCVDKQNVKFAAGDEVTVKGSKFTYGGQVRHHRPVGDARNGTVSAPPRASPPGGSPPKGRPGAAADHS